MMRMIRIVGVALAAFALVGCGSEDEAVEPSNDLAIEAGDLYYEPTNLAASPGDVTFTMRNVGAIEHDLVIEELGDQVIIGLIGAGETETSTIALEAGSYTLYCTVPGHRQAGMEATLSVG